MMGQNGGNQNRLFYSFNLEDHVPASHLLRGIDKFLDLTDLRAFLAPFYSHTGRHRALPWRLEVARQGSTDHPHGTKNGPLRPAKTRPAAPGSSTMPASSTAGPARCSTSRDLHPSYSCALRARAFDRERDENNA
jgi:hypothetical protein